MSSARLSRRCWVLLGCVFFAGCALHDDWDRPLFGHSGATSFYISPRSDVIHARDVAVVARVLRRYKDLSAAEQALVRNAVSQRLNALIALEIQRLAPKYEREREAIRKETDQVARERLLTASRWRQEQEALKNIQRIKAGSVAAACVTTSNQSVLAFADISKNGVSVRKIALEIDRPRSELKEGALILTSSGEKVPFLATNPIPISQP